MIFGKQRKMTESVALLKLGHPAKEKKEEDQGHSDGATRLFSKMVLPNADPRQEPCFQQAAGGVPRQSVRRRRRAKRG